MAETNAARARTPGDLGTGPGAEGAPRGEAAKRADAARAVRGVAALGWKEAKPRHHVAYVVPAIRRLLGEIKPGTRVLDLGCGNGAISSIIVGDDQLDSGCTLVGVDPSESGVAIAREHYPRARWERVVADERVLDVLGEEPFDVVLSLEVVEHVYKPRDWARACATALRPGGVLVCSTPYHGYLKNLAIAVGGKCDNHYQPLKDGGHIKFWSRRTLEKLMRECGLRPGAFAGAGRYPYLWKSMVMIAEREG